MRQIAAFILNGLVLFINKYVDEEGCKIGLIVVFIGINKERTTGSFRISGLCYVLVCNLNVALKNL